MRRRSLLLLLVLLGASAPPCEFRARKKSPGCAVCGGAVAHDMTPLPPSATGKCG
jgi:hypothetical protein